LEGVKRDGELFFTYFFKKKDSDIVSEKVTYAKLYRPYNWIIAMGVHLDDIEAYADQANVASASSVRHLVLVIAAVTACLMAVALVLLSLLERWYFRKTNLAFREKADLDHLTAAYNRRAAEELLKSLFSQFKITGQNSVILMFDIDDFKKINDKYGHDQGDTVLRKLSDALSRQIRSSDHLCRWGGDEFLLVCPSMPESDTAAFAEKLLGLVSGLKIPILSKAGQIQITISIGAVRFIRTDLGFMDAIKRADRAMYRSKEAGKNRATVA
jgi:diguanylate cyclase (GGDEF)-like protein